MAAFLFYSRLDSPVPLSESPLIFIHTAEQFAQTINLLKGKVTILFITHQLPKTLQVDEVVRLGQEVKSSTNQTGDKLSMPKIQDDT